MQIKRKFFLLKVIANNNSVKIYVWKTCKMITRFRVTCCYASKNPCVILHKKQDDDETT